MPELSGEGIQDSNQLPRHAAVPHTARAAAHGASDTSQKAAKVTLAGLEPAIFGSEDQRLIH